MAMRGDRAGQTDQSSESLQPERPAGVFLGGGNPPGPDTPVIGRAGSGRFRFTPDRCSDQKSRWRNPPYQFR